MATRANTDLKNAIIKSKTTVGNAVAIGRGVILITSDQQVDVATAGDDLLCYGFSMEAADATSRISVITFSGSPIAPLKVGTGGVTMGQRVKLVSDGVAGATAGVPAVGWAQQTGSSGDIVGVLLQISAAT